MAPWMKNILVIKLRIKRKASYTTRQSTPPMDTVESIQQVQPPKSWAKVLSSKMKPPKVSRIGIRKEIKSKNTSYKPVSLLEMVSGN
ncbi:hypothetical protein AYI70_g10531 [Smittium culicis]|uniref:Uncharacterized protein n=1 Tax=Smittium culicis TaxID=133412 RepID=A0A1R1X681_9FUNG|nr:hypothetical protein AYI70_g10531 [Smittium culicis]